MMPSTSASPRARFSGVGSHVKLLSAWKPSIVTHRRTFATIAIVKSRGALPRLSSRLNRISWMNVKKPKSVCH